ncbi:PepSY domain-containing protein [Nocardioides sp. InS609-2]|uniref:PepSY domain-containing protein n=1 Tax=Nocardioides sp. InS609-2 TaxID=2760705 RepID=UPI0020BD5D37|nr:PepSY domain-containing protein [Nocardioides sp. InS609-2]
MKKSIAIATGIVLAASVTGGVAMASSGGEDPEPGSQDFSSQQAEDATAAALDATGGGKANSVERDSENGATWEVEVTRTDGSTVDVRLDAAYDVVVIEGDSEDQGE